MRRIKRSLLPVPACQSSAPGMSVDPVTVTPAAADDDNCLSS